jgi:hypothetical protein
LGIDVAVERIERPEPFHDSVSASRAVGESLFAFRCAGQLLTRGRELSGERPRTPI